MAPLRPRTSLRRSGIVVRLLALVLVPLAVLAGVGTSVVRSAGHAADEAGDIEAGVAVVTALATLVDAVQVEQASGQVLSRAAAEGVDLEDAFTLVGDGLRPERVRAATDAALAATPPWAPSVQGLAVELARLRAGVDAGPVAGLDAGEADVGYLTIGRDLHDALTGRARTLQRRAAAIAAGGDVADALAAVLAVGEALHGRADQFNNVVPFVLGTPEEQARARAALATAADDVARALDDLDDVAPGLRQAIEDAQDARASAVIDVAMDAVDAGVPVGDRLDFEDLVELGAGGRAFQPAARDLIVRTGADARAAAGELYRDAQERDFVAVLVMALAVTASLAMAAWVARSITRPLQAISDAAETVGEGQLDVPALAARGPRGLRVVARAFNDLVANLRLLEAKSQALANCDFTNPVLADPLPGPLGQAIQASVSVLSGSMEERDTLERRLAHQATHDALTGLLNRPAAILAVDKALARGFRAGEPVAVLTVDLDGFKLVNDTYGHHVGDEVLRAVARRIQAVVRDGDVVARLGGDEFLVVAEHAGDVEATALARRVIDAIADPLAIADREIVVAGSVGIVLSVDGTGEAVDFLARADLALARARARGRACVELYDESLQRELLRRSEIEQALKAALAAGGGGLELHFQPVVGASDGALHAVEALVRWDRDGQRVFPDEFIPVAEASDLIVDLDVWVLTTAARQACTWPSFEGRELAVAVNVSGRHLLSERLLDSVRAVLDVTGLDPARLVLEVTETVLLTDIPTAAVQLEAIRALGVRVAVDDFGTGYTSLGALQGLPMDVIKVDRSFVAAIHEPRQRSLVSLVTELGHQLGVTVIAEGVETEEQLAELCAIGCDEIQGYLVSRPVPEAELLTRAAGAGLGATSRG